MKLQDVPIQRKLMIIFLLTTAAAMVTMRLAFFVYEYVTFRQAIYRQLVMLGGITANNSTAALAFDNPADAQDILRGLKVDPNISAAGLYDDAGRIFARYPDTLPDEQLPKVAGADGYRFSQGEISGFEPVKEGRKRLGTLYIRVDTASMMREWFIGSLVLAGLIMAIVLVLAAIASRSLHRHISEPIMALAATARTVAEKRDYAVRAPRYGRDELGQLAGDFNLMLERVETQDQEIRDLNRGLEERVIQRTTQLESANKELESFSYSVSHDLRAPLRHIGGYAQMLHKEADPKLNDTERRYLRTIVSSAKGLGVLIDELLAFSRMGRAELRQNAVNMKDLVDEVIRDFQPDCQQRRIGWNVGDLPTATADTAMLRQVWRNLIGNAVKYTSKKEEAVIEVGHALTADGHVFYVRDNGAGFEMKYAQKLFGVFQRLHGANEFEGTGIGLANVRRIVQRHGGKTWAEGEVGKGATFYFTLPVSTEEKSTLTKPSFA